MKTMKKLVFSTLALILITGFISEIRGAEKDLQKTFTWKYSINKDARVTFENYDCNLTIHTWDKGEAEYHLVVDASAKTDDDASKLEKYLDNLKFRAGASSVEIRDNFWKSRNSIMGRITIELENGQKIVLSELTMKGELWIPAGCSFNLNSKYSQINMEDLTGELFLDLYNDNFFGGNVGSKTDIKDKYSTMEFRDLKDLTLDLYNSKLDMKNTGNIKVDSKYSKITALTTGSFNSESYNDKYSFNKTGDINLSAKYTDIKGEVSGKVTLDCYDGSVALNEVKGVTITSKYADFKFEKADEVFIESSYNDKLTCSKLNSIVISESKYCVFRIGELKSSVTDKDGYEDKFMILKTGSEFTGMNVDGKYMNVELSIPKSIDYRIKANIQYPKLDIDNESSFQVRKKIIDGSNIEYEAIKGKERDGMPQVEVKGYEMSVKIIEI
jgi:hypothetical protein